MKKVYFLVGSGAFLVGVLWRSFFEVPESFIVLLFIIAGVFALFSVVERKTLFYLLTIFFFVCVVGVTRADSELRSVALPQESFFGKEVSLLGRVVTEPERRENNLRFVVKVEHEEPFNVLVYTSPLTDVLYGDVLTIEGALRIPEGFETDEGRYFDWGTYLLVRGITYQIFYPDIENNDEGNLTLFEKGRRMLFSLKKSFVENIRRVVPEPEASLLAGEVVGEKSSLGEELEASLRRTGIIHVVVLSGYNVTIIAESLMRLFSFASPVFALYLGVVSIILFAIMTGASATIVRASIMAVLVLFARRYGALYNMGTALLFAAVIMVFVNPHILVHDVGFQLSFIATLGLIYAAPLIERHVRFLPKGGGLREAFVATASTQLFVLPLLLYISGDVSLVSFPVNMLVLPVVPLTMFFGTLTGLFGFFSYSLSALFSWMSTLLLSYQLFIVRFFDSFAAPLLGGTVISASFVVLLYILLAIIITFWYTRGNGREHQ